MVVKAGAELAKNTKIDINVNDLVKKYMIGVGCVLGGIALYLIIRKIKKKNIGNKLNDTAAKAYKYELTKEEKNIAKANGFTEEKATTLANRIYNAMKGVGTDEDTVVAIIESMKSSGELKMLCLAFGTQKYTSWTLQTVHGDLVTWLKDELNDSPRKLKRVRAVFEKFNVLF
ncbi:MAG: hypothetical protein IKR52_08850 [Paludibacteraceae bacterium]|nr:hypothetical protein [Paludibacteraceae bacterium]